MKRTVSASKQFPLVLFFILFLAFIFRFYNLRELFLFGMDAEYEAFLVRNIVNGVHFPAIGVNAADLGIYLGPIFIYLSVIPYILFFGSPMGFAVFASAIGVFTTYVMFRIVKTMFGGKAGYFASFFYAVSFLASFYDRNFWNPTLVPLLSLLICYFIYRINLKQYRYLYFLAVAFGLSFHTHLSLLIYTPLIIWIILKHWQFIGKKILIYSLLLFLSLQLPQIIFEFRHNFTNSRAVITLLTGSQDQNTLKSSVSERGKVFLNYLGRFLWVPPSPDIFVEKGLCKELNSFKKNAYPEMIGLIFLCFIYFTFLHQKSKNENNNPASRLVISIFILSLIAVLFYNRNFQEYYLQYLTPFLAVILGVVASQLWEKRKIQPYIFMFFIIYFVINMLTLLTANNSYSYLKKKKTIKFTREILKDAPYNLEAFGDCTRFAGWRYLFEYYHHRPNSSYMDSYFGWLYQDKNETSPAEKIVLLSMIDPRSSNNSIETWQKEKISFLSRYSVITQKLIDNIHVFILAPKK